MRYINHISDKHLMYAKKTSAFFVSKTEYNCLASQYNELIDDLDHLLRHISALEIALENNKS